MQVRIEKFSPCTTYTRHDIKEAIHKRTNGSKSVDLVSALMTFEQVCEVFKSKTAFTEQVKGKSEACALSTKSPAMDSKVIFDFKIDDLVFILSETSNEMLYDIHIVEWKSTTIII